MKVIFHYDSLFRPSRISSIDTANSIMYTSTKIHLSFFFPTFFFSSFFLLLSYTGWWCLYIFLNTKATFPKNPSFKGILLVFIFQTCQTIEDAVFPILSRILSRIFIEAITNRWILLSNKIRIIFKFLVIIYIKIYILMIKINTLRIFFIIVDWVLKIYIEIFLYIKILEIFIIK